MRALVVWYSTVAVYVVAKGVSDIRTMLSRAKDDCGGEFRVQGSRFKSQTSNLRSQVLDFNVQRGCAEGSIEGNVWNNMAGTKPGRPPAEEIGGEEAVRNLWLSLSTL